SVKGSEEGDNVLPPGVVTGDLQGALNGLGPGVAVVKTMRAGHGRDSRQPLGKRHQRLIVEVRAGHVDQLGGLVLNGLHHFRMTMACRDDGDSGGKVQELVAVHVFHANAAPALGDHRVRAGVAGRDYTVVSLDNAAGVGTRQSGAKLWAVLGVDFRLRNIGSRGTHGSLLIGWGLGSSSETRRGGREKSSSGARRWRRTLGRRQPGTRRAAVTNRCRRD